jgi:hypothetical protein
MDPFDAFADQTQTITLLRTTFGAKDALGIPAKIVTEVSMPGCLVAPTSGSETADGTQDQVIDGLTIYAPYGSPTVAPVDQLRVGTDVFDVFSTEAIWGVTGVVIVGKKVAG